MTDRKLEQVRELSLLMLDICRNASDRPSIALAALSDTLAFIAANGCDGDPEQAKRGLIDLISRLFDEHRAAAKPVNAATWKG